MLGLIADTLQPDPRTQLKTLTGEDLLRGGGEAQTEGDRGGYYVFDRLGEAWLQDDECSWDRFSGAAEFTDPQSAQNIGQRESKGIRDVVVFRRIDAQKR